MLRCRKRGEASSLKLLTTRRWTGRPASSTMVGLGATPLDVRSVRPVPSVSGPPTEDRVHA